MAQQKEPDRDPIREALLHAFPNPHRVGCPGESVLRALARHELSIDHPAREHLSECSPCFREFLDYQAEWKRNRRHTRILLAAAVVLLMTALAAWWGIIYFSGQPTYTNAELAAPQRTVNLWDVGTSRGDQPNSLSAVSLPASLVRVTVILPRFSELGQYTIAVTKDRSGKSILAEGMGSAVPEGSQAVVKVGLDLRRTKEGLYFLSTTREQDQASYYYPLQVGR
jgi:hypothetical protein